MNRLLPVEWDLIVRSNVFFCLIERFSNRIVVSLFWPVGMKDIERFPSEQQIKGSAYLLAHHFAEKFIGIRERPTAVFKVTACIFRGPTRRLHHAIKSYEC